MKAWPVWRRRCVWSPTVVVSEAGQTGVCLCVCLNLVWEFYHSRLTNFCYYHCLCEKKKRRINLFQEFVASYKWTITSTGCFTVLATFPLTVWVIVWKVKVSDNVFALLTHSANCLISSIRKHARDSKRMLLLPRESGLVEYCFLVFQAWNRRLQQNEEPQFLSGKRQKQVGANWVNQPPQTESRYAESSFQTIIVMKPSVPLITKASRCLHLATLEAKLCNSREKCMMSLISWKFKKRISALSIFNVERGKTFSISSSHVIDAMCLEKSLSFPDCKPIKYESINNWSICVQ